MRPVIRDVTGRRGKVQRGHGLLPARLAAPASPNWAAEELRALAACAASAALAIAGTASGLIYLSEGCVNFAESPAVPGLASRLVGSGYLDAAAWAELAGGERSRQEMAAAVVRRGSGGAGELRVLLQLATLDAVLALALPAVGEAADPRTRLMAGRAHWAGTMLYLDVASVLNYVQGAGRRRARPAAAGEARPRSPAPRLPLVPGGSQRAAASQSNGGSMVSNRISPHEPAPPARVVPASADTGPAAGRLTALPRRGRPAEAGLPRSDAPDLGVLGRVLRGLERLD